MDEKEYIQRLEHLVIFLSNIYNQTTKITERELIENNNDIHLKIPLIEGTFNKIAINRIASFSESLKDENGNVKYKFLLDSIIANMEDKY